GTDSTAYRQFSEHGVERAARLQELSDKLIKLRHVQLLDRVGEQEAENYAKMDSRGRPNRWGLAVDEYSGRDDAKYWPTVGATYWAPPLEGVFATSPYFHNGSVRTLWEVLLPPTERAESFRTGTTDFDAKDVGLLDAGAFEYNTKEPGKGNDG